MNDAAYSCARCGRVTDSYGVVLPTEPHGEVLRLCSGGKDTCMEQITVPMPDRYNLQFRELTEEI